MILELKLTQHTRSLLRRRCGFWGCRDLYVLRAMQAYTKLKYQFENFKNYKCCLLQIRIELKKLPFFHYSAYQLDQSFHLANNQSWEGEGRSCWWTLYLHLAQRYISLGMFLRACGCSTNVQFLTPSVVAPEFFHTFSISRDFPIYFLRYSQNNKPQVYRLLSRLHGPKNVFGYMFHF